MHSYEMQNMGKHDYLFFIYLKKKKKNLVKFLSYYKVGMHDMCRTNKPSAQ